MLKDEYTASYGWFTRPEVGRGQKGREPFLTQRKVKTAPQPPVHIHTHLCAQTHFPSLSVSFWLLSHPSSLPPSLPLYPPLLYFIISALKLYLWFCFNFFSPFLSPPLPSLSSFFLTSTLPSWVPAPPAQTRAHNHFIFYTDCILTVPFLYFNMF